MGPSLVWLGGGTVEQAPDVLIELVQRVRQVLELSGVEPFEEADPFGGHIGHQLFGQRLSSR